jgi:phospholipid-binding lipoprotein MlaA
MIVIFQNSYAKSIDIIDNTTEIQTSSDESSDDFEDEFEDEFSDNKSGDEDIDPLSGYNRAMTSFNDGFYTFVLFPVANTYKDVVPVGGRVAVSNFFDNLFFPVRFINNLLQLKFTNTAEETARFCINSTLGLLGLFDVADSWFGLKEHDEDFGQTLGYYGVGGGFHIVLPFLGPSNLRDTLSMSVDWEAQPTIFKENRPYNLTKSTKESLGVTSFKYLNEGSFNIKEYESLKKDAVDLYPFLKNIYEQNRKSKIKN